MKRVLVLAALLAFAPAPARAAVYFDFMRDTNTNSLLIETWQDAATGRIYAQHSWRAGSGFTTNECQVGAGWLPAGTYNLVGHWNHYDGSKIKGRVWQLSDKRCWNGTLRTELFIHSEETADNGQYCPTSGDDPFCWEGDSDYVSLGCIKLSRAAPYPSHLAQANNDWDAWDGRHGYFSATGRVYVFG